MSVDKELIRYKKNLYGSNFSAISEAWTIYIQDHHIGSEVMEHKLEPKDVARMMSLMKLTRISAIEEKLELMKTIRSMDSERKALVRAMIDSEKDLEAYDWIASNYDEYQEL